MLGHLHATLTQPLPTLYSSSPKSAIEAAFSIHGFQTTASGKPCLVICACWGARVWCVDAWGWASVFGFDAPLVCVEDARTGGGGGGRWSWRRAADYVLECTSNFNEEQGCPAPVGRELAEVGACASCMGEAEAEILEDRYLEGSPGGAVGDGDRVGRRDVHAVHLRVGSRWSRGHVVIMWPCGGWRRIRPCVGGMMWVGMARVRACGWAGVRGRERREGGKNATRSS
eukprot:305003-Chlamydomonas_euryale.AAC.5